MPPQTHAGCSAKRRVATQDEKDAHKLTCRRRCYWVDVIITAEAQKAALGGKAAPKATKGGKAAPTPNTKAPKKRGAPEIIDVEIEEEDEDEEFDDDEEEAPKPKPKKKKKGGAASKLDAVLASLGAGQ